MLNLARRSSIMEFEMMSRGSMLNFKVFLKKTWLLERTWMYFHTNVSGNVLMLNSSI